MPTPGERQELAHDQRTSQNISCNTLSPPHQPPPATQPPSENAPPQKTPFRQPLHPTSYPQLVCVQLSRIPPRVRRSTPRNAPKPLLQSLCDQAKILCATPKPTPLGSYYVVSVRSFSHGCPRRRCQVLFCTGGSIGIAVPKQNKCTDRAPSTCHSYSTDRAPQNPDVVVTTSANSKSR